MTGRGKFVTVEGCELVGKTHLAQGLANQLRDEGHQTIHSREPGGTPLADRIRQVFKNDGDDKEYILPITELMLISAARAQHVQQTIKPALERGVHVICDRYIDSTRVYQGDLGGLDNRLIESCLQATTFDIEPDLTFLLTCDYLVSVKRFKMRADDDSVNRYDQLSIDEQGHQQIQGYFIALANKFPERIVTIDTSTSTVDGAVNKARKIIADRLGITVNGT